MVMFCIHNINKRATLRVSDMVRLAIALVFAETRHVFQAYLAH